MVRELAKVSVSVLAHGEGYRGSVMVRELAKVEEYRGLVGLVQGQG